ncbi:MAG: hypothetical protein PHU51_00405 [Candidatus Nanoarchaeia archaeon]|nr:hypothetical protein [Candidatus Nanoarchaeia archaeon]
MKTKLVQTTIYFILLILFTSFVTAIPNPAQTYCHNMGYRTNLNNSNCIFDDDNQCPLWEFYEGKCGQEYVHKLDCKELGEHKSPGFECCEGLIPVNPDSVGEDGTCKNIIGMWAVCLACGDGVCDRIESNELYQNNYWSENECNCPTDCFNQTNILTEEEILLKIDDFSNIKSVELLNQNNESTYVVKGTENAKFLNLFNVNLGFETELNAKTGNMISNKNSWWGIFCKKIN